jgi:hypothetical protein
MKHKRSTNSINGRFRVPVLDSEKGVVLVMVLILSVISLSFMAALMLMATTRTQISPTRYASACEIVKAADDISARQWMNEVCRLLQGQQHLQVITSLFLHSPCRVRLWDRTVLQRNWRMLRQSGTQGAAIQWLLILQSPEVLICPLICRGQARPMLFMPR